MNCKHVKSSDFKKDVTVILSKLVSNSDDGTPQKAVIEEVNKRAYVISSESLTLRRQEVYTAQGYNIRRLKEFVIRYDDRITTKHQIKYKEQIYEIKDMENLEEKDKYLLLKCEVVE